MASPWTPTSPTSTSARPWARTWCGSPSAATARWERASATGRSLGERAVPDPTLEQRATFGATDGCGFDQEGNLWVTLVMANKVIAITPTGRVEVIIHDPTGELMDWPTNVSWGGADLRDLYIGSVRKDYVLHARCPMAGAPLVHQQ